MAEENIKHSQNLDYDSSEEPSSQSLPDLTRRLAHSLQKPFHCQTCSKKFASKKSLADHMRAHSGEKPFQCEICAKLFLRSGDLKRHIMMHSGEKPYQCEICQKQFPRKGNLQLHRITHTKSRPHQCVLCERFFAQKSGLTQHMLVHTGVKRFQCELCRKEFARKAYLQKHMLSHRAVPLDCEVCGKSFSASRNLKLHALSHVAHKLYRCYLCEEVYTQKTAYFKHLASHNEPLECQVCFKEFTNVHSFEKHSRTHAVEVKNVSEVSVNGAHDIKLKEVSRKHENSNDCAVEIENVPADMSIDTSDSKEVPTIDEEHCNAHVVENNDNMFINIYDMGEVPWADDKSCNNIQVVVIESSEDMSINIRDPDLKVSQTDGKQSSVCPVLLRERNVSRTDEQHPVAVIKVPQVNGEHPNAYPVALENNS